MTTTLDIQTRLKALGFNSGLLDGKPGPKTEAAIRMFQAARALTVDGIAGPKTLAALFPAMGAPGPKPAAATGVVPGAWMPAALMQRIIVHWTAGAHKASGLDRSHYHILVEGDGTLVRGTPSIDLNEAPLRQGYAAHTLGCNGGSIGVSLCCMAGAVENPFSAGPAPMTRMQWDQLPLVVADLCRRYLIPVLPRTVLSHAEVQETLGIKQRGKWDISRLPFDAGTQGARACGDRLRAAVIAAL